MNLLSRPLSTAATLLIGLVAGLIEGRILFAPAVSDSSRTPEKQEKRSSGKGTKIGAVRKVEPKDVKQAIGELMGDPTFKDGASSSFLEFVSQTGELSEDELLAALDQLFSDSAAESERGLQKDAILSTLLLRLVAMDSKAAGEWMVLHSKEASVEAMKAVWRAMAWQDPGLMGQLILRMPEEEWVSLQSIRLGIMKQQNPTLAAATLVDVLTGDPNLRHDYTNVMADVMREYQKVDPLAAANLMLKIGLSPAYRETTYFTYYLAKVLADWRDRDIAAAAGWVLQQKGDAAALAASMFIQEGEKSLLCDRSTEVLISFAGADMKDSNVQSVVRHFANYFMEEGGEEAARNWVAGIADPELRAVAQKLKNQAWIEADPTSASVWLAGEVPGPEKDFLIRKLVNKIYYDDPERAFAWAQKVENEQLRQWGMAQSMRTWLKTDFVSASRALETTSPEFQEEVINSSSGK